MTEIGVIGAGILGGTLARRLAATGHAVQVANSRGPDSLSDVVGDGVAAGWAGAVAATSDVLFLALPYRAFTDVAQLIAERAGEQTILVDTGNYYPGRDGALLGFDDANPEPDTLWLSKLIGRPIYKAFNNITYATIRDGGLPRGASQRIGLPVAGPEGAGKQRLNRLVDELGFDPVDGGTVDESWRQQPGSPVYATDLTATEVQTYLASARTGDAETYRQNRRKFDDVTAAGYDSIHALRAQGLPLDDILDAISVQTKNAVSKVVGAQ